MSLIAIYVFGLVCLGWGLVFGVKLKRPGGVAGPLGVWVVGTELRLGGLIGRGLGWILADEGRLSFCGERAERPPE